MQLARILIGVDLTTPSIEAAAWAAQRFAPAAEVVIAHCISPLLPEQCVAAERRHAEARFHELEQRVGAERCSHHILRGEPARSLADLAAELDVDLIAVGAHEEHPERDPALGTTAQRLIRCSSVPVLLCCEMPFGAPRSMLLPLDAADVSTTLADWTSGLAERFEARLALVHIEAPHDAARRMQARPSSRRRASTTTMWHRIARELPPQRVFVDAVPGDSAGAVLAEARRFRTDLVMVDAPDESIENPMTPVDSVLLQTHCPVLVIPATDDQP
ncbi:MAG TPA: universal stress protein [Gemmatimonadaceae bacterium]|nr:universal stress protein [Gemmatimonadaceae bacterium]